MRRMYSKPQLLEAVEQEAEVNGLKAFENIVDKDGHKRFIEENITIEELTGVSSPYAKWSLSGSHLLIVISVNVANGTAIPNNSYLAKINLPDWIKSKIVAGYVSILDTKTITLRASDYTSQTLTAALIKETHGLTIQTSSQAFTADRNGRVSFDLLIDNE